MEDQIVINETWQSFIYSEFKKDYFNEIREIYKDQSITPNIFQIYNAFNLCPLDKLKVVILGQDPYPTAGQAHGLAFSSLAPEIPKSLVNIFKELIRDPNVNFNEMPSHSNLTSWAEQGVLLLNTSLTTTVGNRGKHLKQWRQFTNNCIQYISENKTGIVFILWGNPAKAKKEMIDKEKHYILESNHPSPLSATKPPIPFIGNGHFSRCNELLGDDNEIEWRI